MKLGRRILFQADESGGGTAVAEPQVTETGGYLNPSEADLIAAANEELRSVANKLRSGEILTEEQVSDPAPADHGTQEVATKPPAAPPQVATPPAPAGPAGVPAFLSRFAKQPEQTGEQDAPATQGREDAQRPAVSASGEIDREAFSRMLETPQGVNRLIGLLYESGREENVAIARQLDAARQAPAQETGSGPATTTEPDPLDIPPFNADEARAAIEKAVRAELEAEHTPPIMDYDEDGNPIPVPTKFKPEVNPAHRRQLEKEVARQLENAEAKHEAKRAFAQTEKWRREQEAQTKAQRLQQIESAYEEDSRRIENIITTGIPLRAGGMEFSSKELFTDASGNPIPMAKDAFRYIRKQIESDFFRMTEDPAHKPEYDITPLQSRLPKSGPGSQDPRVLTRELTRLAVETFIAQSMPQSGQTAAAPPPVNGTQNGVKPQQPRQSWPANMPGPVSNAAQQPPQQGATQSADDMVAEFNRQLAQEYGGNPPTDVLEKRYSQLLRDMQAAAR